MKLLNITDCLRAYPAYLESLARRFPGLEKLPHQEQQRVINEDHFVWASAFGQSMGPLGYEVMNVDRGIISLQHAWAGEHGHDPRRLSLDDIVVKQARHFKPDVLVYGPESPELLRRLRNEVRTIRLVLGQVGSHFSLGRAWGLMDFVVTCAPESIGRLAALGVRARHLHHAFDPAILGRLGKTAVPIQMSFIGSIVRRNEFHLWRERMVAGISRAVPLQIFSPTADVRPRDWLKAAGAGAAYAAIGVLRKTGSLSRIRSLSLIARAERVASPFRLPVNRALARHLRPGVYGMEYFQVLRDSEVSLNVHADTSPRHASNIRLFEATGVGSCLLTDWKTSLPELYDPELEVVTFRSVDEAIEKALWLAENPKRRADIAAAGMRRTARDHTFSHRAHQIAEIIMEEMR